MTHQATYEAFINGLPRELGVRVAADAEDNCFFAGPASGANDERYLAALRTAQMIADDPKAFGLGAYA